MSLLTAANKALSENRFEDAAFLFYAGQIRAKADLRIYEPIETGGDSPAVVIQVLSFQIGADVNPAIMRNRRRFAAVTKRLSSWSPPYDAEYSPGWDYKNAIPLAERGKVFAEIKNTRLKQMEDFNTLLANDEYYALFRKVQEYNLGSQAIRFIEGDDYTPLTISYEEYETAEERATQIEKEMGIEGAFYKKLD